MLDEIYIITINPHMKTWIKRSVFCAEFIQQLLQSCKVIAQQQILRLENLRDVWNIAVSPTKASGWF